MLKAVSMTAARSSRFGWLALVAAPVLLSGAVWAVQRPVPDPAGTTGRVTLSIVGTTDLHGRVFPSDGRGGLAQLGGYLRNLRAARAVDGGAVLLLDAGDTFQGGIESNLSEGALVVDAYNLLGYDALAIGNHEFEYGALDTVSGGGESPDMRGALKAAAARARFPFLAANLIDESHTTPGGVAERRGRPPSSTPQVFWWVIVGVMDPRRAHQDARRQRPGAPHGAARTHGRGRGEAAAPRRGADVVVVLAHARRVVRAVRRSGRPVVMRPRCGDLPTGQTAPSPSRRRHRGGTHSRGGGARGGGHPHRPGLFGGESVCSPGSDRRARCRGRVGAGLLTPGAVCRARPRRVVHGRWALHRRLTKVG